jgi:hypothetical protein
MGCCLAVRYFCGESLLAVGEHMGTVINFPKRCQEINYYGLELFVESCSKLLDTLPDETRSTAKEEFDRLVECLLQLMVACQKEAHQ